MTDDAKFHTHPTVQEQNEIQVLIQVLVGLLRICPYNMTVIGSTLQSLFFNFVVQEMKEHGDDPAFRDRVRLSGERLLTLADAPIEQLDVWVNMLCDKPGAEPS